MNRSQILELIKNNLDSNEIDLLIDDLNNVKIEEIKTALSKEDKLALFMSYFKGKTDAYAEKYESKTGKTGYSIVCQKRDIYGACNHLCKKCNERVDLPLTPSVYNQHLLGNKVVGIYPMTNDENCYFLAFDFDNKNKSVNIEKDIAALRKVCDEYKIPYGIERSRSGLGYHLWIFFDEKIKAETARKLGSLLLSCAFKKRDSLSIQTFDRMFPNQDYLPKGGYGNLIALPFQNSAMKYGNTLFVDENFFPYKDQWTFLSSLNKLDLQNIQVLINNLSSTTIDIGHEVKDLRKEIIEKNSRNIVYPKYIDVVLDDKVYIDKANLEGDVISKFRRLGSFANPEFYKKQRMRMNTYNTPMVIDCGKTDEIYIILPRGTFDYVNEICSTNSINLNLLDKRNVGTKQDFEFKGMLSGEQIKALESLKKYDNGILHAPTGFGKTVVCCKLIADINVNTLVIVNKVKLLKQWKDRIKQLTNINDIGELGHNKNKLKGKVDIATIQSLKNRTDLLSNYGMIVVDECHHLAAYTYEQIVSDARSKYLFGVSATPNREDGHSPIVRMQCGDVRYEVDYGEFKKNLGIEIVVKVIETKVQIPNGMNDLLDVEIDSLIANDYERSNKIVEDIIREFLCGKNILILTNRINHLDYLESKLQEYKNNLFVYRSGMGIKKEKQFIEKENLIVANKENKIIIATGAYIGEGFDDSSLDDLFLTMPISGFTRSIQYTGRLFRKREGKKIATIFDYVDMNLPNTRNKYVKRRKHYQKLGYQFMYKENSLLENI